MAEEKVLNASELSEQEQIRRAKLLKYQEEGHDPFVITKFDRTHTSAQILSSFDALENQASALLGDAEKGIVNMSVSVRLTAFPCSVQSKRRLRLTPFGAKFFSRHIRTSQNSYSDMETTRPSSLDFSAAKAIMWFRQVSSISQMLSLLCPHSKSWNATTIPPSPPP